MVMFEESQYCNTEDVLRTLENITQLNTYKLHTELVLRTLENIIL